VLVLFVGYTTWQKWSELRERAESIRADWDAEKLSVGWWQMFEKERSEALKSLAKNDPTTPTIILNGDPIPRDQFWKYLERREKDIETGRQKTVDIMARAKKTMSLEQEMNWMLSVGGGTVAYGFFNWRSIQLKQDKVLEMELKKYG
jgi:hypothetical protein